MPNGFQPLAVEREIAEEMAATLGRIGAVFARSRERAWEAMEGWESCRAGEEKKKARRGRALWEALDEAERLRYFLIVQREALGLRSHEEVERKYPLPRPPGRSPAAGDPASPRLAWPGAFSRGRRRKSSG